MDINQLIEIVKNKILREISVESIEIVGLDKTCVFYTRADDCTSHNDTAFCSLRGGPFIYIRNDSDHYNVHQFPTERGGDIEEKYPSQDNDCWSCSMTQRVIEDSIKRTEEFKAFYSGQHEKDENGKPKPNTMCPSLEPPPPTPTPTPAPAPTPSSVMCNPKTTPPQLCPGGKPCPPCGKVACECPPINSNSNSENSLFN